MSERDNYIREMLARNRLKPKAGHLWCEKILESQEIAIQGVGTVTGAVTKSGLVLVGKGDSQDESIKSKLLLVRAVGDEPASWHFRYFHKERDWNTSFKAQGVDVGTVVMVRSGAGIEQEAGDRFVDIRYDEIVAIGQPEGVGDEPMLPGPGWLLVDLTVDTSDSRIGSIYVRDDALDTVRDGEAQFATVIAVAANVETDGLAAGQGIVIDRYRFTEYVQVGKTRFIPVDEVLGLVESAP